MHHRYGTAAVGLLGVVAIALGVLGPGRLPTIGGGSWVIVGIGVAYAASAGAAWAILEAKSDRFAISLAPAILAPVAALFAYAGLDVLGTLTGRPVIASAIVVVFAIALSFGLGAAWKPRRQWAIVGALALAAVPLVAVGLWALQPGPPEDRDLIVLVGMLALLVVPIVAAPIYALGRVVRRRTPDTAPSPHPPLVAAALPLVLVLAGFVAAPHFARETIYGPWPVVLPAVALLAIILQAVRVARRE